MVALPPIPLPSLKGGINSFSGDAPLETAAEASNVVVDDGEVRSRDSFTSIIHGGLFFYPPGRCCVQDATPTTIAERGAGMAESDEQPLIIYVGCDEQFDGFHWPAAEDGGPGGSNKKLILEYWNGSAWTTVPWFLDTTTRYDEDFAYHEPLAKVGTIHWRRSQLTGWATRTQGSVTSFYWIRVTMVLNSATTTASPQNAVLVWTLRRPGVRVFRRAAINGLFAGRIGTKATLLIGSDRYPARGLEKGASLSEWPFNVHSPNQLDLTARYAAGWYGSLTWPLAVGPGDVGGSSAPSGTAGALTDQEPDFNYIFDSPYGAIAVGGVATADDIAPNAAGSVNSFTSTDARLLEFGDNAFEHFLVECTLNTSGTGTPANQIRQIIRYTVSGGVATIEVAIANTGGDAFSIAPDTQNRFRIIRPPSRMYVSQADQDFQPTTGITASLIPLERTRTYEPNPDDYITSAQVCHFEMRNRLNRALDAGRRWSFTVDGINQGVVGINGGLPILFDGTSARYLAADTTSDLANRLVGRLSEVGPDGYAVDEQLVDPKSVLREVPPAGDYIIDFGGSLVVAQGKRLRWSSQHAANSIWPFANEASIRDDKGDDIIGLKILGDRLIVFTPTAIHAGVLQSSGGIGFAPVSVGLGFAANDAVDVYPLGENLALIGLNSDGVYACSGNEPVPIINDWTMIEPNGVNVTRLSNAVACTWRSASAFLFAFPSAGSNINDRLGYLDLAAPDRPRVWVWTHPDGITSLTTAMLNGKEKLLIGTEDGFVQTLVHASTDDGRSISWSIKTHPIAPFGARPGMLHAVNLTVMAQAAAGTVTLRVYGDRKKTASYNAAIPVDLGQATYGTAVYGTSRYAEQVYKTFTRKLGLGIKCSQFQVEMVGTGFFRYREAELEARVLPSGRV